MDWTHSHHYNTRLSSLVIHYNDLPLVSQGGEVQYLLWLTTC